MRMQVSKKTLCSTSSQSIPSRPSIDSVTSFVDNFVLPRDPAKWAKEYGKQLSTQHVAYLQQVREELQLQSHNLRMFHARPRPDHSPGEDPYELGDMKDLNAMSKLVKLVSAAVRHTKKMTRLYAEVSPPFMATMFPTNIVLPTVHAHPKQAAKLRCSHRSRPHFH